MTAVYVHVNIIARDWKKLARFYEDVFGCIPLLPERDLSGEWLDRATGIKGAHIYGIHLRLPGYDKDHNGGGKDNGDGSAGKPVDVHISGPTLEIFQYNTPAKERVEEKPCVEKVALPSPDSPGFGHIAFSVADVPATAEAVFAHGGSAAGERTVREIPGAGIIDFQYVRDPEGNIIEVQRWLDAPGERSISAVPEGEKK
ncbi:MAG: VOC family protein [Spirochaetes bacterium]|nr:VOC family protein [Spirochaetota bacterium]